MMKANKLYRQFLETLKEQGALSYDVGEGFTNMLADPPKEVFKLLDKKVVFEPEDGSNYSHLFYLDKENQLNSIAFQSGTIGTVSPSEWDRFTEFLIDVYNTDDRPQVKQQVLKIFDRVIQTEDEAREFAGYLQRLEEEGKEIPAEFKETVVKVLPTYYLNGIVEGVFGGMSISELQDLWRKGEEINLGQKIIPADEIKEYLKGSFEALKDCVNGDCTKGWSDYVATLESDEDEEGIEDLEKQLAYVDFYLDYLFPDEEKGIEVKRQRYRGRNQEMEIDNGMWR
ncbi:hypothetical protein [Persephonella sp.]